MGSIKFYEDSKNNLWIGTQLGLNLFNREEGSFSRFYLNPEEKFKMVFLRSLKKIVRKIIFEDWSERLWVASYGGGLYLV
ncbi:MAG: hypothetical protein H6560_05230 [Lewinellaceae bacterium]|nr:hypothetical protein [Lewinellaceae bacterium]